MKNISDYFLMRYIIRQIEKILFILSNSSKFTKEQNGKVCVMMTNFNSS